MSISLRGPLGLSHCLLLHFLFLHGMVVFKFWFEISSLSITAFDCVKVVHGHVTVGLKLSVIGVRIVLNRNSGRGSFIRLMRKHFKSRAVPAHTRSRIQISA